MEKDLALSGVDHQFTSITPEDLIKEMAKLCDALDRKNQLQNLLYRVDVAPKFSGVPDYEALSIRIWDRVLQKVWFRMNYQSDKNLDV